MTKFAFIPSANSLVRILFNISVGLMVLILCNGSAYSDIGLANTRLSFPAAPICELATAPGLIALEWMRIGGAASPIGCPVAPFHDDGSGAGAQTFQHGEIAISPNVWEKGVVAAYQEGNSIRVDWTVSWTEPSHFNYDKFLVRWDFNGQHQDAGDYCTKNAGTRGTGDQCDIVADMAQVQNVFLHYYEDTHLRTNGNWSFAANHGDGNYRIVVEGCDERTFNSSICRQGWMHPVSVNFHTIKDASDAYPIDLRGIKSANTVKQSREALRDRGAAYVLNAACRMLPHNLYRNEQDATNAILAKLAYVGIFDSRFCPGRNIDNQQEAFDWLMQQSTQSKSGTTIDKCGPPVGCRTGEYDVALSGLIPILFNFGETMPPDVRNHIINDLLNKRGPLDPDELFVKGSITIGSITVGLIPESENHINMIESSRFLTNQILFEQSGKAEFDNTKNGLADWWLTRLASYLRTDFIEYNARPYQEYSTRGLQNLASFAKDERVRTAASMVLEYVSAKLAVSSNDLRRVVPYRRKHEYNDADLLAWHSDPQSGRLLALAGNFDILNDAPRHGPWAAAYGGGMALTALASRYRISDSVLDLIVNRQHRVFYQRLHHYADELYASEPSFLISAGGHYATYAYTVEGFGQTDDIGNALPTTLMPTNRFVSRDDLIRFDGDSDDVKRSNMCVAPDFACGLNPVIPKAMLHLGASCIDHHLSDWTFIDFSPHCSGAINPNGASYGIFVAVYKRGSVGLLEAFDTFVNPNISFSEFIDGVLKRNGNVVYSLTGENTYTTTIGEEIKFTISPDSRIVSIANGPQAPSESDFASGSVLQSSGQSGLVTITNVYTGGSLTLDDHDPMKPLFAFSKGTALAADSCKLGFIWREANSNDKTCVLPEAHELAKKQNKEAATHLAGSGPSGPDTCKQGYVWREANSGDHACVTPDERAQVSFENRLNPSRLAWPPSTPE